MGKITLRLSKEYFIFVLFKSLVRLHVGKLLKANQTHCLQMNVRTGRIWCLICLCEVYLHSNDPPFSPHVSFLSKVLNDVRNSANTVSLLQEPREAVAKAKFTRTLLPIRGRVFNDHGESHRAIIVDTDEEDDSGSVFPRGLTGLCNLGNTCYMNAALQTLSNCTPLAEYFRSASSMAPFASHCFSRTVEPPVSRSFRLLLQSIWSRGRSGCTSPQLLLNQIRIHCPQFRGWGQQDAQEFIRCFLDLLHRELRQPLYPWECRDEISRAGTVSEREQSSVSSLNNISNTSLSAQNSSENHTPPARRNSSSSSCSRCSNSVDRYETADSGWSSDGDPCNISMVSAVNQGKERKRCRSMSPNVLERSSASESALVRRSELTESPKSYKSIVNDVFDGQLRSTVKTFLYAFQLRISLNDWQIMRVVGMVVSKVIRLLPFQEPEDNFSNKGWFWWLSMWLWSLYGYIFRTSITLVDALNAFFSPDDLRDENMYSCEKCAKQKFVLAFGEENHFFENHGFLNSIISLFRLRNGVKMCKITRLPEVLCIHLKRFRHDSTYSTKVSTTVSFPLYDLDLSPFLSSSCHAKDELALYDLCAFVTHHGSSAESGHYVAYCKNELDNNWYEFDDTVVTKLEPADVLTKEAYVLFYQKKSTERMETIKNNVRLLSGKEGKVSWILNLYGNSTSLQLYLYKFGLPHYYISRDWLNRLSTFSNPGPITNYDFLCRHGQILPRKASDLVEHYVIVESDTWEYLFKEFGGGPVCTKLHYCSQCQSAYQRLQCKRTYEIKTFKAIESRTREAASVFPALTYSYYLHPNAVSKSWLSKWRSFVDGESLVPPGPIDNRPLLTRSSNDSSIYFSKSASYAELPRELWLFFHSIYGGGPEVQFFYEI
ncbi:unnamed protein product [Enterobius vermicularis]|uniref:Ubiquitin carboxyl-terminal hydrolase n=1 Tax=Enterobius vermicularis TaxID=51028 RepID=A0A0N4VBR3_ENTVE|nr:unnamed protein product [Enterobius vermicularis]